MNLNMNRWMAALLAWVFALGIQAQEVEYTKEDSALVVKLLKDAQTERGEENRVFYFAKEFVGTPYIKNAPKPTGQRSKLDSKEHLSVNLHEFDCTTFIETVVALALCDKQKKRTFDDYCKNLIMVRYRNGIMTDYTSRLHYFIWWAEDNERLGILKDICQEDTIGGVFSAKLTVRINYMTAYSALYPLLRAQPEIAKTIKQYEDESNGKTIRYIPKKNLSWQQNSSLGIIHDGDIIAMQTLKPGIDTGHLGIAFWQDGQLHFLHASSLYKKVLMSKETFYEYEMKQSNHMGIRVFRFNDN